MIMIENRDIIDTFQNDERSVTKNFVEIFLFCFKKINHRALVVENLG